MQKCAKFCKVHQNYAILCRKRDPLFRIWNTKIDVSIIKVCIVWKYPECISSVSCTFMKAYVIFEPFLVTSDLFRPFFFWGGGIFGPSCILGWFCGDFGPFFGSIRVTLGCFWHHFGVVLVSFWPILGVFSLFRPFWWVLGLKKCVETPKPYFPEDKLELRSVRNQVKRTRIVPKKAISHGDGNFILLVSPLNRHFTKFDFCINCMCLVAR